MGLFDYTVYSVIKRNALVYGERTCFVCGSKRVTHQEYLGRVDRLARGLWAAGLRQGDRFTVLSKNNLEYMDLYGAAARLGAVMVPINWRLSQDEVEYMISDSGSKLVFAEEEYLATAAGAADGAGGVERRYAISGARDGFTAFESLLSAGGETPDVEPQAADPWIIMYTAAVEVRPRGAVLTQANLLAGNVQYQYFWGLDREDVHAVILPLYHITALGMALSTWQAGGANIILPKFDAREALQCFQNEKATMFGSFPPILQMLLDEMDKESYDLSSLIRVFGLDKHDIITRFAEKATVEFWTAFGQSETSGLLTMGLAGDHPKSAGAVGFLAEVEVVDDYGRLLERGQTGEIVVRGPVVFQGYWNLAKDNEFTFRDGWHHTGDLGLIDEDGYLFYKGRTPQKELIKPGGENVYPAEVERVIMEHPAVKEVCVIGVKDAQWGEAVKAVTALEAGASLTAEELIEFVAQKIARYKKPKYIDFVDALPRTEGGTVDRAKVKETHGG